MCVHSDGLLAHVKLGRTEVFPAPIYCPLASYYRQNANDLESPAMFDMAHYVASGNAHLFSVETSWVAVTRAGQRWMLSHPVPWSTHIF